MIKIFKVLALITIVGFVSTKHSAHNDSDASPTVDQRDRCWKLCWKKPIELVDKCIRDCRGVADLTNVEAKSDSDDDRSDDDNSDDDRSNDDNSDDDRSDDDNSEDDQSERRHRSIDRVRDVMRRRRDASNRDVMRRKKRDNSLDRDNDVMHRKKRADSLDSDRNVMRKNRDISRDRDVMRKNRNISRDRDVMRRNRDDSRDSDSWFDWDAAISKFD
jgi:hypothetical protein